MNRFTSPSGKMARVIVSLSTAVLLSGAGTVLPQIASAVTVEELLAQIAALQAQLLALQAQQGGPAAGGSCGFTRDLSQGVTGDDVKCLQQYLNSAAHQVASSGAGSPGSETIFFGARTKAAVSSWQAANGVSPTAGYFGARSRAKYNSLVAAVTPTPPPATPGVPPATPAGSGLTVSAASSQPGDSLAPLGAARIPTTKMSLSASSDGDVTVNSVTVERQGPAADTSVSSVILLDEDGLQIGLSKTLNSNHQAILSQKFVVKAGTTRTLTVAFNRPTTGSDGGSIVKLAVVAVDAGSSKVSGSLPVVGSPITLNSTLTIGTATLQRGVQDPGSSQTKEIGTTGYIFSAIRLTAGSAEDVSVKSISWNQSGSAASSDLANIKINVDGTDYSATVSADGKYYTASFGSGIDVTKGNQKEVYVKGDIVDGSNRTVDFDLYRYTDLYVVGKQFGYGITSTASEVAASADDGNFHAGNPNFDAFQATIGAGTITVTASTAIPAQNIAINLSDQPLGGFDVDIKGESITVSSIVFRLSPAGSGASAQDIDNVSLVDNTTGKVLAGPIDNGGGSLTFTDAVTFPVGKRAYALKGKLTSTAWVSDITIAASTTPNTGWTSITGDTSGTTITAANTGVVTANTMTVKAASANISISPTPTAQTIIRGASAFTLANLVFDSTASGENVRYTSAMVQYNGAIAADVTNCALFDGTTQLNTGSNIVNPSALGDTTFTLDNNLTVVKGTSKIVALKCDLSRSGTGDYTQWTFGDNDGTAPSETFGATGLVSGNSVTPTVASSSVTNKMALATAGTLTVTLDASSPAVALAQSGQEVKVAVLRFTAANEDMDVKRVGLQLSNTASNTPSDITELSLWDGATQVGFVTSTSSDTGLTVTVSGLNVLKGVDKVVDIKAKLAPIGLDLTGRPGHLVTVNWDQVAENASSTTYAVGGQSSSNVYSSGSDTASAGVRVVRAYPTMSVLTVPSTSLADATQKALHRFSVSAPVGTNGVSLYKFTFIISTSGDDGIPDFTITNLRLYAFTGSNFSGGKYSSSGQLNNGGLFSSDSVLDGQEGDRATTTDYAVYFNPVTDTSSAPEAISIAAGETIYFELRGDVSGADAGDTATVQIAGDSAWFPAVCGGGGSTCDDVGLGVGASVNYAFATSAVNVDEALIGSSGGGRVATGGNNDVAGSGDDFIWSGNSTTTHSGEAGRAGPDWYNGFVVPGLPAAGATAVTFSL